MSGTWIVSDFPWDVNKYKSNYDTEHWGLCRAFMETHKSRFPEQKLVHLTEAFYQMGVYGSSYDPKTTRMVNALAVEVLDTYLKSHPGLLFHPFDKSAVVIPTEALTSHVTQSGEIEKELDQSSSIWNVQVDQNIIANVLTEVDMKRLFNGLVIIYDIQRTSTMIDNKVTILEDTFKRSKFGPCHWAKDDTNNNICPIRLTLKWRNVKLAEAVGGDEKSLKTRLAQAVLSKMAKFSSGIEAKWSYYRDGSLPDSFSKANPRNTQIYKVLRRSQFKAMAEIISYVDMFANSNSFAEAILGMDFSSQEKKQLMEYIDKTWSTKLTYRTLSKTGVKNKSESHVFFYHIRSGEELRHWLLTTGGENDRYRLIPPGNHRRAGKCDDNVREVLTTNNDEKQKPAGMSVEEQPKEIIPLTPPVETNKRSEIILQKGVLMKNGESVKDKDDSEKNKTIEKKDNLDAVKPIDEGGEDLEKLLDGFVMFYDANKTSEIDKDDWFTALCESFKLSKFGPLEVISENVKPLRTRCVFKWRDRTLASAEGLTETQAKTAATLQLISKLEPFTYIIQAKDEYFCGGKVPQFLEEPDQSKKDFIRLVRRKDLPSYYAIFQTIDEFSRSQSRGEIIFGPDFTWELKNEIVVYLKAKNLSHRYFTTNDQKPWTHLAVYKAIKPEELKDYLLQNGGENPKYKLILPSKAEPISEKTSDEKATKEKEKLATPSAKKPLSNVAEKRKQLPEEPSPSSAPAEIDIDSNKIHINLKKFKVDKVDYPEDTGGDFPGLILWIGIRKNSVWQKNIFNILLESFKMSKFGGLFIDESEEHLWLKREPLKKCVIKHARKVLAVGLGESKAEAKNSASLQVLRQLRKHCYTIQAKESYFKEGKATPYDFHPDPEKSHVYKEIKRNTFKDRAAMVKYVDEFAKKSCPEEVIFGEDFTYDEREHILNHCRKIDLSYRLMKCQSIIKNKNMHSHIAIYNQQPLPVIKVELIKAGGENDMYRLIPPGGIITNQNNKAYRKENTSEDLKRRLLLCGGENKKYHLIPPGKYDEREMWPETIENSKEDLSLNKGIFTANLPAKLYSVHDSKPRESKQDYLQKQNLPQQNQTKPNQPQQNEKPNQTTITSQIPSSCSIVADYGATSPNKKNVKDNSAPGSQPPAVQMVDSKPDEKNVSSDLSENKTNDPEKNASVTNSNNGTNTAVSLQFKGKTTDKQIVPPASQSQPVRAKHQLNRPQAQQNQLNRPQTQQNQLNRPQAQQNQPNRPQAQQNQPNRHQVQQNQPNRPQTQQNQPNKSRAQQNRPIKCQVQQNQSFGPSFVLHNQQIESQPIPFGPQPQFVPHRHEVPFGPQPLSIPSPPMYSQPLMDTPLQFGPNPPTYVQQYPREIGSAMVPEMELMNQPSPNFAPEEINSKPSTSVQSQISVPSVTITVDNSPQKSDLREELSKKRLAESQSKGVNIKEDGSDGWSRKVFVAEDINQRENTDQSNASHDLREKLRHKDLRDTKGFGEPIKRNQPEQSNSRCDIRYQQRVSPRRNRSRDGSRERWRYKDSSPEQRIVRHRESSHERRVFHDPTRDIESDKSRARSRSRSPRRLVHHRDLWDNIPAVLTDSIFMYKYVKQDSTTESDPYALLRATRALNFNVDFDFIKEQTAIDEWYVSVELISDQHKFHPLVGEGMARTLKEASLKAANHAVDTVQKACRVIKPNYRYFCEGGEPDFIMRKNPMKTAKYEIIQNMDPDTPLARFTIEMMFNMFISSDLEDIYFLATDFSYMERVLVVEMANQMNLWWRLFGPRHPNVKPDDIVSTQHVCVFKQKSALQVIRELLENGGSTAKYTLVDPRENSLTQPRPREFRR